MFTNKKNVNFSTLIRKLKKKKQIDRGPKKKKLRRVNKKPEFETRSEKSFGLLSIKQKDEKKTKKI